MVRINSPSLHDALPIYLAGRRGDLRAEQIGDIEHVDHALAECRNMRRGDVEAELRQRGGQFVQQSGTVQARSEEHMSELQSLAYLVCRLLLEINTCTRS